MGLGNPGIRYENTRHNIGHLVLDHLASIAGAKFQKHAKASAEVIEGHMNLAGQIQRVIYAKNTTYMNNSGSAVASLCNYYRVEPSEVIVVHDEIDIPFGSLRVKIGGSEGGHNGLKSITNSLDTRQYLRIRVGVGRPSGNQDTADYVLSPFARGEQKVLDELIIEAGNCVESLIEKGLLATQQQFHSKA